MIKLILLIIGIREECRTGGRRAALVADGFVRESIWKIKESEEADQQVCMIMSGAKDIATLRRFYEHGHGWSTWGSACIAVVTYKAGHSALVFLDGDYLARERSELLSGGYRTSLAVFVGSKEKVHKTSNARQLLMRR